MALQLYKNKGGRSSKPKISITTAGQIGINAQCANKYFKHKGYAQLYYDIEKKIIGIKGFDVGNEYTFKLTKSGVSETYSIAGRSFLNSFEFDFSKSRKFIPEWDVKNEMLLVKLE